MTRSMRPPARFTALIAILGLVSFSAVADEGKKDKKEKDEEAEPIEVYSNSVEKEELYDPLVFGGFLEAETSRPVYSAVKGQVSRLYVSAGERVKKGSRLLKIRPEGLGQVYEPHMVRAPLTGVVTSLALDEGDKVVPDESLLRVSQLDEFFTTIHVNYEDSFEVKQANHVEAVLAPGTKRETRVPVEVRSVAPAADKVSGTYPVEVNVSCSKEQAKECSSLLRLGAMVKIVVKKNLRKGFRVSLKSLFENRKKALVVDKKGRAKWVEVELGRYFGDEVEVTKGLNEGARIVTSYADRPEEGDKLKVVSREQDIAKKDGKKAKKKKDAKKG